MTETLLFVGVGAILIVAVATLVTAILTLRSARRYVELAEERMEGLREGQARLLRLLHEERAARNPEREDRSSPAEGPDEGAPEHREPSRDETPSQREEPETGKLPTGHLGARSEPETESRTPSPAVWHPHPDDDVTPRGVSAGRVSRKSDAPMKMFRTLYDRYLDNYEGYVKLAERLHRSRADDEITVGSAAEREWEERLRRAYDGIERTIARLDILEESNPELATDDRVSQRAGIARSHSNLPPQRSRRAVTDEERTDIFTGS